MSDYQKMRTKSIRTASWESNVMIHGIQWGVERRGWVGPQQTLTGDNSGRIREGHNSQIPDRGGHPHGQVHYREKSQDKVRLV
jgi:hypothetical protein